MQIATVNPTGLNEIKEALAARHKLGGGHFTDKMIGAWASAAEESFDNGNGMEFEIPACDTISGRPEIVRISESGYDVQTEE